MTNNSMTGPGGTVNEAPPTDADEAVRRVRKLHVEETIMTVRPGCGPDGDCEHQDECPEDFPFKVCGQCRAQAESANYYWEEHTDAWASIRWPCDTIRALSDEVSA